jgi:hypothetical protein
MKGPEASYHQAMEKLVFGNSRQYAPNATTRTDYPILTVQDDPSYCAANHEIYVESSGPEGGPYTLVFELSKKQIKHAYGTYEEQKASGRVNDIEFPGK